MDEDRRIRFLVAPTLFVASLLWGAWSDHAWRDFMVATLKDHEWPKLIAAIAGGGLLVFVAGYVIGTWTYFVLRLFFRYRPQCWGKSRFHEVAMSCVAFKRVWGKVGYGNSNRSQGLFAGVSLTGSTMRSDGDANKNLYGKELSGQDIVFKHEVTAPPAASELLAELHKISAARKP